jgi:hypothetical protein
VSDNNGTEVFEKIMSANLQRAIDFVKYAEAKNGALLTFGSAWILAIIGLLSNEKSLPFGISTALAIAFEKSLPFGIGAVLAMALPFFIGAVTLAMLSFFPQMNWAILLKGKPAGSKNLLFFGDIASMTFSDFERTLRQRYFQSGREGLSEEYLHDITMQVFANSKIAKRKLRMFQNGILLIAVAVSIIIIPVVYSIIEKLWGH